MKNLRKTVSRAMNSVPAASETGVPRRAWGDAIRVEGGVGKLFASLLRLADDLRLVLSGSEAALALLVHFGAGCDA